MNVSFLVNWLSLGSFLRNMIRKTVRNIGFVVLLLLVGLSSQSQVLRDPEAFERVRNSVSEIYNGGYDEAEATYQYLNRKFPAHPINYLLKGMSIYWQNFPLMPGTKNGDLFEQYMQKAIVLSEERLKENENDAEALLSALGSAGLLLLYLADNGHSREVISLAPKTYQWVMKSFDFTGSYKDFYFITGLYNYYREAYAEAHPVYKPVMVFFPHGDKKLGLKQLKIGSDSAIFLKAESTTFLAGIYQSFEKDPYRALIFSKKLADTYKKNQQFRLSYIRDLLVLNKYDEAEKVMNGRDYASISGYFQAQANIFKGIIQEKKYRNYTMAEQHYLAGISKAKPYGDIGAEFVAYGYYGLSRLSAINGDVKTSRHFRKQAKDLSDFDHVNFDE